MPWRRSARAPRRQRTPPTRKRRRAQYLKRKDIPDAEAAAPAAAETEAPGPAAAGEPEEEPRIAGTEPSIAQLPRDFGAFVESMYLEAMLYMGAIADPRTGQTIEDIDLAKYKIDVLIMLQEKTEGNLTDDEQRQLEEVLYQLRMLYLQKSKAAKL